MQSTRGGSRAKQQESCKCRKCGWVRAPCPEYGKTRRACHKRNIFAVGCRTKPQVSELQGNEDDLEALTIGSRSNRSDWIITATVRGRLITFKVDTGSQANWLPASLCAKMSLKPQLKPSSAVLRSYGENMQDQTFGYREARSDLA
ncbi:hypothetical protein MRX96_044481 [Rhipicephalus microplus]